MLEKHGFQVANTSATKKGSDHNVIRVYREGVKLIEYLMPSANPLGYIKRVTSGRHKSNLWKLCNDHGMTREQFTDIFGELDDRKPKYMRT